MRDLPEYVDRLLEINAEYGAQSFVRKQFINAVSAAYFSSDRSVREYAEKIWGL